MSDYIQWYDPKDNVLVIVQRVYNRLLELYTPEEISEKWDLHYENAAWIADASTEDLYNLCRTDYFALMKTCRHLRKLKDIFEFASHEWDNEVLYPFTDERKLLYYSRQYFWTNCWPEDGSNDWKEDFDELLDEFRDYAKHSPEIRATATEKIKAFFTHDQRLFRHLIDRRLKREREAIEANTRRVRARVEEFRRQNSSNCLIDLTGDTAIIYLG